MSLDVREIANDGWPHFIHAIYDDNDESNVVLDYGDVNPWTETLNDKKTKVQGGARDRGRGRGRVRGRGRGRGRGKGRGQFEDVIPHSWQSLDWRAEINSTEGARSRCENYKEILDDMSKSETPEDRSLCELLKIVTATCEENSEEKSEQSEILIGDLSKYLDDADYSDEPDLAQWDDIKLQPLNTEEKRCDVGDESNIEEIGLKGDKSSVEEIGLKGDESSVEEIGLKGDESSVEEIKLKDDESSIEEVELQGDGSSIEVIDIESDESCTEMAVMKTDKDNLNDAQYESDQSTIKCNKQRLLKIWIAVMKMNICQVRAAKLHMHLSSEEDEDFKSETETKGTTNTFTENSDTSTLTDLDYFSFKNSSDSSHSTSKKDLNLKDSHVEKKTKKRKSLCRRSLRSKSREDYEDYEDYADYNESVR